MLAVLGALLVAAVASASVPTRQISSDPYTNASSQHRTQLEPDSYAWGSTIVAAFQSGRFFDGGSSNVGVSTSRTGGRSWAKNFLPGITVNQGGTYARATDPSIAYDARHGVWIASTLALDSSGTGAAVLGSRSTDGGRSWQNPVTVATTSDTFFDKNWIACDNWTQSPYYGNCYTEWDDNGLGNELLMSTSTDGGLTWGPALSPSGAPSGLGGQPLAQPNGTVVVPYTANYSAVRAFRSTNGGQSWSSPVTVMSQTRHNPAGGLRAPPLPSAEVDAAGKIYVASYDCRFRTGCPANDIAISTSTDGVSWSAVQRIPIDAITSGIDHFIPGIGVDPATSGSSARIGVAYYYYPVSNCTSATCQLHVGFIASADGGATWSQSVTLAGPISLSWIANTTQGRMVGDYISTSFSGGSAHPVFAIANAPTGGVFDETAATAGIDVAALTSGHRVRTGGDVVKVRPRPRGTGLGEFPRTH